MEWACQKFLTTLITRTLGGCRLLFVRIVYHALKLRLNLYEVLWLQQHTLGYSKLWAVVWMSSPRFATELFDTDPSKLSLERYGWRDPDNTHIYIIYWGWLKWWTFPSSLAKFRVQFSPHAFSWDLRKSWVG